MNPVIDALEYGIKLWWSNLIQASGSCRVLFPAPTESLAQSLHERLLEIGLPSYLVVEKGSLPPSRAGRILLPDGVTSVRDGSFVCVLEPGTLSRLQDSVAGDGGGIRGLVVPDEWPWRQGDATEFSFQGSFFDRWMESAGFKTGCRSALRQLVLLARDALEQSPDRARTLFDEMLDFRVGEESATPDANLREFMCHLGMPAPEKGVDLGDSFPPATIRDLIESGKLAARMRGGDSRQSALSRVESVAATHGVDVPWLESQVQGMLDRLNQLRSSGETAVSLRGVLPSTIPDWSRLPRSILADLFSESPVESLEVEATWVAEEGSRFVSLEGGRICLSSSERLPPIKVRIPHLRGDALVVVKSGQSELAQATVSDAVTSTVELDGSRLTKAALKIRLQAEASSGRGNGSLSLERVCAVREAFVSVPWTDPETGHVKTVESLDFRRADEVEVETLSIASSTRAYVVFAGTVAEPVVRLGNDQVDCSTVATGIISFEIDPTDPRLSGGTGEFVILAGDREVRFTLDSGMVHRGEVTLEQALLKEVQRGSSKVKIDALLNAVGAEREAATMLGSPSEGDKARFRLASEAFEDGPDQWRPVVIPAGTKLGRALEAAGGIRIVTGTLNELPTTLATTPDVDAFARAALDAYAAARQQLMAHFEGRFGGFPRAGYSRYAAFGFSTQGDEVGTRLAASYLEAFSGLHRELAQPREGRSYGCKFLLNYVDAVVVFDGARVSHALLGPWHPLVVARRLCVGTALVASAHKWRRTHVSKHHRLVVLLAEIVGFRWFAGLSGSSSQPVALQAVATSDPGWTLCAPCEVDRFGPIAESVAGMMGIDCRLDGPAAGGSVKAYLADYRRAFPSKRAIVLHAEDGYDAWKVSRIARDYLSQVDGEPTEAGERLSAGIHLVFDNVPASDPSPLPWQSPPVCVYDSGGPGIRAAVEVDIQLASMPRPAHFLPLTAKERMLSTPRGGALAAVVHLPARHLDAGAGGLSASRWIDNISVGEDSDALGGAYKRAVSTTQETSGGGHAISLETVRMPRGDAPTAAWTVIPGDKVDPAVLLEWSRASSAAGEPRVLWDFRLAMTRSPDSYFVMSQVPPGLPTLLGASTFFASRQTALSALSELSSLGVALGSEAYRSRTKALGVIGLIGAVRFTKLLLAKLSAPESGIEGAQFLLPVDSFQDLLGGDADSDFEGFDHDSRRADLLAVLVRRPTNGPIQLAFCSIESKYDGATFGQAQADKALGQAAKTLSRIIDLAREAVPGHALAERLALARLIEFGLRLSPVDDLSFHAAVIGAVLSGDFTASELGSNGCIVVSSECGLPTTTVSARPEGLWVRLSSKQWPGEHGEGAIAAMVAEAARLAPPVWIERDDAVSRIVPSGPDAGHAHAIDTRDPASAGIVDPLPANVSILLGVDDSQKPVVWSSGANPNNNIMVSGSSGTGKTQLVKSIICQMRPPKGKQNPVLILDFKNDFASDSDFIRESNMEVQYVSFDGLPYNPLIPAPQLDPHTGKSVFHIAQHVSGIVSAFQKPYGLGDQQAAALKDAIRDALAAHGVPATGVVPSDSSLDFPDFRIVGDALRVGNDRAYRRLDPIFDLEIFREENRLVRFDSLLGKGVIVDLSAIQSEQIQNTLAQLLVYSAHRYLNTLPHSPSLRQVLVFDEAHRILKSDYIERFVRECRAYGISVILSSQYPDDFPPDTADNLATKILHGNGKKTDRIKALQSSLGSTSDIQERLDMPVFHAVMPGLRGTPRFLRTLAYPHLLVLRHVGEGWRGVDGAVPGLHAGSLGHIVQDLEEMGLLERRGGGLYLTGSRAEE